MTTWLEEIIEAFEAMGGDAHYNDLYEYIERNTKRTLTANWKAIVRSVIEDNSSEATFRAGKDIFYSIGGIGSGHWGIKDDDTIIENLEEDLLSEDDYEQQPPADIVAYNELRSCADLFRMYDRGILEIQPDFQREVVWSSAAQTRFIDSLIKQLPIPSMCFSLDYKTQKWQVIDGLQRMSSIIRFLSDKDWRLSKLQDIDQKIAGKKVSDFLGEDSNLNLFYQRVEDLTLPITVLRCDYTKRSHTNYLFAIFHRLNTGGTKLNNQEIRNCIYNGNFNSKLKELNENEKWRTINRMRPGKSYRFTKVEMILRLFAFYDEWSSYNGRLAQFLNTYMEENRNLPIDDLDSKELLFNRTANILHDKIIEEPIPKMSNSVLEAVLFGIANNVDYLDTQPSNAAKNLFDKLLDDDSLSSETLKEDISSREKVLSRLNAAKTIFSGS